MTAPETHRRLAAVLQSAEKGEGLGGEEIRFLTGLRDREHLEALFASARRLRARYFGEKIFLYGFLYISTYCRNNCNFCYYRKSNRECVRYRKDAGEIVSAARALSQTGVHLIDLTMGEDPEILNSGKGGYDWLADVVRSVRDETGLPVMVSPGVVPEDVLHMLAEAGATWYACYQETHSRELFKRLRPGQSYDERWNGKAAAHALGMLIEEGLLGGVGESGNDLADSMEAMHRLEADQIRIMNFVPQCGTPMAGRAQSSRLRELVAAAVMRLVFPDRLIPASLDVDGLAGLGERLDSGVNVITSLVPPGKGLAGVAQSSLDIEEGNRSAGRVKRILSENGMRAATLEEYTAWIEQRRSVVMADRSPRWSAC
ncbi:MAG: methylornithine synthase PylB [Deltaproteobacteria bacterium]|nr:methylornithine synthase PylB [Deltaproteobacteria bacterium]